MVRLASAILIAAVVALLVLASVAYPEPASAEPLASATELSAQQQRRSRTRIVVRPERYLSYPGPNAVRQCEAWLQPENRTSGPVITPQMRCWWIRG